MLVDEQKSKQTEPEPMSLPPNHLSYNVGFKYDAPAEADAPFS